MDLLRFLNSVRKHWWALMSCAAFTLLGMWVLYANKSNGWALQATFGLAGFCLLWACFLAWRDEHQKVTELQKAQEVDAAARASLPIQLPRVDVQVLQGTTLADGPPQIGMRTVQPDEGLRRGGLNGSILIVEFKLRHLGGRLPTSIEIKPVYSAGGHYSLHFDDLPYLANGAEETLRFEVWRLDQPPSRKARILGSGDSLLGEFVRDSSYDGRVSVPLVVWYRDGLDSRNKRLRLLFDYSRDKFDIIDDYLEFSYHKNT